MCMAYKVIEKTATPIVNGIKCVIKKLHEEWKMPRICLAYKHFKKLCLLPKSGLAMWHEINGMA